MWIFHPQFTRSIPRTSERSRHGFRAFTLIEVLVVVGIIAVLVTLLLPSLSRAKDQARSLSCRANLKSLTTGMFMYVGTHKVLPGTHSLFFMQILFGQEWSRPSGVTWDGARDRLKGLTYSPAYKQPYHLDPEFVADVPGKGTLFPYIKQPAAYVCPSDHPGEADNTPLGGGNGRLSYSLNAYVGYKSPENLQGFAYVGDSLNDLLPDHHRRVSFKAGQIVKFAPARFMAMFEDHPSFHMNTSFPDGNFNCIDRLGTRHLLQPGPKGAASQGRASIAFLDGHAESRLYSSETLGRELFAEFGQPHMWRESGPPDRANISAFIRKLPGPCPW